jgi:hypothetical protein
VQASSVSANALLDIFITVNLLPYDMAAIGCNLGGTNCLLAIGGKSARVEATRVICVCSNWEFGTCSSSLCLGKNLSDTLNSWANELFREFDVCFQ